MPTADDCIPQIFCCRTRVAKLGPTGAPLTGAGNAYVTDALLKATITPNYDAGTEVKETNACGATYIDVLPRPTLVRGDLTIEFLTPDPYLHAILISQGALLTPGSGGVGFAYPPIGQLVDDGVSIELYTQRMIDGALSVVHPYAQWALPKVQNLQLGARDFTNAAQHSPFVGQCFENPLWGDGPGNDFDAESDRFAQWIPCDTLPAVVCGPITTVAS